MRVRWFFWLLLACSCISVVVFAAQWPSHVPVHVQVYVDQSMPSAAKTTTLTLHLTDPQGLPIEQAEISSKAAMTNMVMEVQQQRVIALGQGHYRIHFRLYMAGPWQVTVNAHAAGFTYIQSTMMIHVV